MKLIHYHLPGTGACWGLVDEADRIRCVATDPGSAGAFLSALLQWREPVRLLREAAGVDTGLRCADLAAAPPEPGTPHLLAPIDHQEVWAAGVTYLRSKVARMEESEGAARFYDLVYDAERPELFLKATPSRVSGPGQPVRIRRDARWNVPEPEVALLLSPELRIIGYTVGNDMSSRDIEGENPLYLPQAKVYRQACGLGPAIWLETETRGHRELAIRLEIERGGETVFTGDTSSAQMKRKFAELAGWLGRDNVFPHGVFLLTGTGLVPGDDFTLKAGDIVRITVPEIGTLANPVVRGEG
jgi:2-dehydro-3-deoxy-D-arabinonate dehydratase